MAKAYQLAGRPIGQGELIWFATGALELSYQKPVAIDESVTLMARILEAKERKNNPVLLPYFQGEGMCIGQTGCRTRT